MAKSIRSAAPGAAAQRRELVEQAGLRADPVVLDARAEPRQLGAVGLLGAGDARAARGTSAASSAADEDEARALRDVAREGEPRAADVDARRAQLGHRAAHERAPAVRRGRARRRRTRRDSPRSRASARISPPASGSASTVTPRSIANGSASPPL